MSTKVPYQKFEKEDKFHETENHEFNSPVIGPSISFYEDIRHSGIDVIGKMAWGTHFCQFFSTKQDLLDILVPYFKKGLENNECCVWVTSGFLDEEEVIAAMRKQIPRFSDFLKNGQIEVFPYDNWYLKKGKFELNRVLEQWIEKYNRAIARGYEGLRVSGNPFWIDNKKDWNDFTEYEAEINNVINNYKMLVLCTYSLDKCGAEEIIDVVTNHDFALIKRSGKWVRIENTAHKKTEEALKQSEEKFKIIATNTPDHIFVQDKNLRYTFILNPQLGLSEKEIIGKTDYELLEKKVVAPLVRIKEKVLKNGVSESIQIPLPDKDGNMQYFEGSIVPKYDIQGKVDGIIGYFQNISERKKTEDHLKNEKDFVNAILDIAGNLIVVLDKNARIIRFNKACEKITRYTAEEVAGKSFIDIFLLPEEKKTVKKVFDNLVAGQFPNTHENYWIGKDKNKHLILWSNTAIINSEGIVENVISSGTDITERKKAELLLKENDERLRLAQVSAKVGIWDWNLKNGKLEFSDELNQLYGLAPATIKTYEDWRKLVYPEDIERFENERDSAIARHESFNLEYRIFHSSGKVCWINAKGGAIYNESGGVERVLGVNIDITSHKKMEDLLRESEKRLNKSQEIAHLGSWELDIIKNKLTWSDEVYRMFGYKPQEFEATYEAFLDSVHPEDRQLVDSAYSNSLHNEKDSYEIEHRIIKKSDGGIRTVFEKCEHIRDNSGRIIRSLGMVEDITDRIKTEHALQRNNERLEILSETASALLASNEPQKIVDELCKRVMNFLDCHVFFNFIADEKAGKLHLNAYEGISDKKAQEIQWIGFGDAVCGCVARDGQRIIAENIPDTKDKRTNLVRSLGIKAYACHPLLDKKKVIGTLSFGTRSRTHFVDDEIALMKSVADLVAIAMNRVIAEKELHDTKSYLENLINYANAPIIVWNPESEIQLFNNAFEHLTGYTPGEVTGKKLDLLFPKETILDSKEKIRRSIMEHWETVEIPILCKNNEIRTVLWNSANIYEDDNVTLISTIAQGNDITERKRKEKELDNLNRVLSAHNKSSHALTHATDEISYLNEICRIVVNVCDHPMVWIGYIDDKKDKAVIPVAYAGFDKGYIEKLNVTWSDDERGRGPTGTAIRTGKLSECRNMSTDPEFKLWKNEAVKRGYSSSIAIPLISKGKTLGAISIYSTEPDSFTEDEKNLFIDLADDLAYGITTIRTQVARTKAEEELFHTKNYLENLINYANAPIIVWNPKSEIQLFNNAFERLTGYSSQEVTGKKLDILFPTETISESKEKIERSIMEQWETVEIPILCKGNEVRTILWNSANIYDEGGKKLISTIAQGNDITERKTAENQLNKYATDLKDLNATKDKFFRIIAHDLKNPFASLLGSAEILSKNPGQYNPETIQQFAELIYNSAKSGYLLLENLLEWSRSQTGTIEFNPEKLSIRELIDSNLSNFRIRALNKKIELLSEIRKDCEILADRNMLGTILRNLLSNALKFTHAGGKVMVRADKNDTYFTFSVTDTGTGIPTDSIDKLFRIDVKYTNPGTDQETGTGLGLLLCKEFVERHGGIIWVNSIEGKGSEFKFTIPINV